MNVGVLYFQCSEGSLFNLPLLQQLFWHLEEFPLKTVGLKLKLKQWTLSLPTNLKEISHELIDYKKYPFIFGTLIIKSKIPHEANYGKQNFPYKDKNTLKTN